MTRIVTPTLDNTGYCRIDCKINATSRRDAPSTQAAEEEKGKEKATIVGEFHHSDAVLRAGSGHISGCALSIVSSLFHCQLFDAQWSFISAFFIAFNLVPYFVELQCSKITSVRNLNQLSRHTVANLTMAEMYVDTYIGVVYIVCFVTFGLVVLSMCGDLAYKGTVLAVP